MVSTSAPSMNTSSTERKRDETFWFEDGTIAIVAQNTEFRVYKGQLAQRFPVFKTDLRTFGASTTAYEGSLNGGPLVPVLIVADSARDWRHVLTLVSNTLSDQRFFPRSSADPSFDVISACIRLGHKYDLTSVYEQALSYLKGHFTTSLVVFHRTPTWVPRNFEPEHAIGVVNLALMTGERTLLPLAVLVCCRLGEDMLEGFTYGDGERETLSQEGLALCFGAHARLLSATILIYFTTYAPLSANCCERGEGDDKCRRSLQTLAELLALRAQGPIKPNPFLTLDYNKSASNAPRLCKPCQEAIKDRQLTRMVENWLRLPSMLGIDIPEWLDRDRVMEEPEEPGSSCSIQ